MPLYSGGKVWEGIWNQTHFVVLNFCLERLQHVTISHDKARSIRWCQWPELFRTHRTVNFCNGDNGVRNISESTWVQEFRFSHPMQIFYMISRTLSRMTNRYIYSLETFLEPGNSRSAARCLIHSDTQCSKVRYIYITIYIYNI